MRNKVGKNKAKEKCIPPLSSRPWTLRFSKNSTPPPGLEDGDTLTIVSQEQNLDTEAIIGVVTDKKGTSYPLNGQVDAEFMVTFFVTSGVSVYFFKGTVHFAEAEMSMEGRFTRVSIAGLDEGNWSATATPPPEEDESKRRRKQAPRDSR